VIILHKILIVDDTKNERECIRFLIERFKFPLEISEASNGKEACEIIGNSHFDILFTDVKMPFIDGLTLSKEALDLQPKIKIIVFSGHDEFKYAKEALRLGVKEYLLKPVVPREFYDVITKILAEFGKESDMGAIIEGHQEYEPLISNSSRIETIKKYIYKNYDADLSLDVLAQLIYVHQDYLSRVFKKECGVTVNRFIRNYRMEKAKDLLINTHLKVRVICTSVGYKNYSYFCQSFKEHFGATPEKIRQIKRGV